MTKNIQFQIVVLISILYISGCGSEAASPGNDTLDPGSDVIFETDAEIAFLENSKDSTQTDVYIKDLESGDLKFFITLSDVYIEHYHNAEYNNGNLYIILRIGFDGEANKEWRDELWKYSGTGEGEKLYAAKGFDFRVSPDGGLIGIETQGNLFFVDPQGSVLQEFLPSAIFPDQGEGRLLFEKWAVDSSTFWVSLRIGPSPKYFAYVTAGSWKTMSYYVGDLQIGEFDLNANTGMLVYSDHPVLYDLDSATQFSESKKAVSLFIFNFEPYERAQIAISAGQLFAPKWLDDFTVEYNNPGGGPRLTVTIP